MTRNAAYLDMIEKRREIVAQLRLRQLSMREIVVALQNQGMVNPDTKLPFDLATIKRDIDALKEGWQASYSAATDEHATRQLAEIAEIKRLAWSQKDGRLALSAIEKEMKLLGTMKQPDGLNIPLDVVMRLIRAIEAVGRSPSEEFELMINEIHERANTNS